MMTREEVEQMLVDKLTVINLYRADASRHGESQTMFWSEEDRSFFWCKYWFGDKGWFKRKILAHFKGQNVKEIDGGLIFS